jgi:homoserine dehydrogenase
MKPVRLGLLGCGTVGGGVVRLLKTHAEYLARSVGAPLELARILVRDGDRDRVVPEVDRALLTGDAEVLLGDHSIDIIVEVMGGVDPARQYVERAMDSGRSVVTANKALLAKHGPDLVARAVQRRVDLAFEASVGGGIPVIRVLREALVGDSVVKLEGIVNGTCNYVLTRMRNEGLGFDEVVRDAQAKGYAEADPSLDVDGHDAAHKLVVLAMMAFGARIDGQTVPTEGIRGIDPIDHRFAERFGFVIKHLAIGRRTPSGLELRVHPALVREDTALANVNGVLNAIAIEGRALGPCLLSGRGAGDMPTAVSVVGDICDVARAKLSGVSGLATSGMSLRAGPVAPIDDVRGRYYLRFEVHDRPGVLARLAGGLGDAGVSIEQMVQEGGGGSTGVPVQIVMLTHEAVERDIRRALAEIKSSGVAARDAMLLRIQE